MQICFKKGLFIYNFFKNEILNLEYFGFNLYSKLCLLYFTIMNFSFRYNRQEVKVDNGPSMDSYSSLFHHNAYV